MPLPRRQKSEPTPSSNAPTPTEPRRSSVRGRLSGEALDYTVWEQEAPALASTMEACERSNATPLLPRRQISAEKCHEDVADLDKLVQRVAARSGCPELVAVARQHSGARAQATIERQGSASSQKTSARAQPLERIASREARRDPTGATRNTAALERARAARARPQPEVRQRLSIVSIAFEADGAISP